MILDPTKIPPYSYPDEVARGWHQRMLRLEELLKKAIPEIEQLVELPKKYKMMEMYPGSDKATGLRTLAFQSAEEWLVEVQKELGGP